MQITRYRCLILFKVEFPRQTLEKYLHINFHENQPSENRVVRCELTYTHIHAEDNGRFSQFCEHA